MTDPLWLYTNCPHYARNIVSPLSSSLAPSLHLSLKTLGLIVASSMGKQLLIQLVIPWQHYKIAILLGFIFPAFTSTTNVFNNL